MLIGLAGPALVGKDTVGKRLRGPRFAFADELKKAAAHALGITTQELEARKKELRFFLEAFGAAARLLDGDFWIKKVRDQWISQSLEWAKITDVRHKNEAEWIHRAGGRVFFLHRDGIKPASEHEAQNLNALIDMEYVTHIRNDGTPEETAQLIMNSISPKSLSLHGATDIQTTSQQIQLGVA